MYTACYSCSLCFIPIPLLLVTDILPEILKRGEEAVHVYKQALKNGKTQIPRVKFVLLGEAGHGKTSLLRLLEGEEFVPEWNSTEGIECGLVSSETLDGTDDACWKKNDRFNSIDAYSGILGKNLPEPEVAATAKSKTIWDDLTEAGADQHIARLFRFPPPRVAVPLSSRPTQPLAMFAPTHGVPSAGLAPCHGVQEAHLHSPSSQHHLRSPQRTQPPPLYPAVDREHTRRPQPQQPQQPREAPVQEEESASPPQRPAEEQDPGIKGQLKVTPDVSRPTSVFADPVISRRNLGRRLRSRWSSAQQVEKPKLTFTTYDFAGQDLYRPMHHCFITQRSVFVIVYNSQEYNKLRKEKDESRFKYISYWFNTVSAYTEVMGDPELGKKPPVFLVGTHRGPYNGREKKFSKLTPEDEKEIREDLKNCYFIDDNHDRYLGHLKGSVEDHVYFVESSQEGEESGAPDLRRCLRKKADSLPYMKGEHPVQWLQLEERLKDRGLIPLAVVKEEAKEVGFLFPPSGGECKEFDLAMRFLHDIGKIAYPCK